MLRVHDTGAVAGFAAWSWMSGRRSTCLVDLYCHSAFWNEAPRLFEALDLPEADRTIAYVDADCTEKSRVLRAAGFRQAELLRNVPVNWCRPEIGFLPRSRFGANLGDITLRPVRESAMRRPAAE